MANVKIYPSGPFGNTTANRGQAVEVDVARLEGAYPLASFANAGSLSASSWPAAGSATHVESDLPGFEGDAILWEAFPAVRARLGLGQAAARIGGVSIWAIAAVAGLGWYLLRGK
jgi:hypothetical protein